MEYPATGSKRLSPKNRGTLRCRRVAPSQAEAIADIMKSNTPSKTSRMELSQKSEAEILSIANPIMDNLMDASTHVDYERHIRDFSDRLKTQLSKERLLWICQEYQSTKGFFADREFVALFRRPDSIALLWRQRFSRQDGEFVAEMVLIQKDDRYLVDHVMVF